MQPTKRELTIASGLAESPSALFIKSTGLYTRMAGTSIASPLVFPLRMLRAAPE